MNNILLNKPATASDYYAPFTPAKAVDGTISPASRWVSSKTTATTPSWLQIDLQGTFCVNQYIMAFMGSTGLWNSAQYNVKTFKVQGSMDGGTFFDLDIVSNNTNASINKNLTPTWVRYLRVYITSGLNCNSGVSSIVDFQAFEAANVPMLSNLVPSIGSLNPSFNSRIFNYSINVESMVPNIAFTPSAASGMTIKVNDQTVASGTLSNPIALNPGDNLITIAVTSAGINTIYNIHVNKAASVSYLTGLSLMDSDGNDVDLTPPFVKQTFSYTISIDSGIPSVKIKPVAELGSSVIKVNGTVVTSNTWSALIPVNNGSSIPILVDSTTYTIVVHKS
jgi:hypothetical protein